MKNLILIVLLVVIGFSVNAQDAISNKYKINTSGTISGGILIDSFVIVFKTIFIKDIDSTGWKIEIDAETYSDTTYAARLNNDSIDNNLKFTIPKSYVDSILNIGRGKLNNVYQSGYVVGYE